MNTIAQNNPPELIPPTHEEIAKVAYYFFEERGRQPGHDVEDWLRAVAHVTVDIKHVRHPEGEARRNPENSSRRRTP
jgi:hypothetical protein